MYLLFYSTTMPDPIELAPDYYLHNFTKLTQHALEWYRDLLQNPELDWLARFNQLDVKTQCLLVRLLSRKGEWFRSDKLSYVEIGDIETALRSLERNQFIVINGPIMTQDLADQLLTKPELCTLFFPANKSLRKSQLVAQLEAVEFNQFDQLGFMVIKLQQAQIIDVLLALFFANTHQDLSQFVLDDLGLHQFEGYQLSTERRFFSHRSELDQLLHLSELHHRYLDSDRKDRNSLLSMLDEIATPIDHKFLERKRQHLINDMARDLERLEEWVPCLEWYKQTTLPPSRERRARVYDKLDNIPPMCDVVTDILLAPYDVAEQEVAQKLNHRLLRKLGQRVAREAKPVVSEHHLALDLSQQRVELVVKQHFESLGYQVFYNENLLLTALFGLAFWQAIFAPVEGAFINRYQYRPLDLYHDDFTDKRQQLVGSIFYQLEHTDPVYLIDVYQQKYGIANPFVHWEGVSLELIEAGIKHFSSQQLIELFKVMLKDLKLYRSGMPDLILFKSGKFEWVEVKGPGDKLQDNQWRWIKEFIRLGLPISVAYVVDQR